MKKILLILSILLLSTHSLLAVTTIIYVTPTGSSATSLDGLSWANAVSLDRGKTLSNYYFGQGIDNQVWVQAGTYNLSAAFQLNSNFAFYGGFAGNEMNFSQRNWKVNQTILNQTGTTQVIWGSQQTDVLLDGFIFQGAKVTTSVSACGQVCNGTTLRNCIIRNNKTVGQATLKLNAISGSTKGVVIDNCLIVNNECSTSPSVINNPGGVPLTIINTTIANNYNATAGTQAAIVSPTSTAALNVYNCVFYNNKNGTTEAPSLGPNTGKVLANNAWDIAPTDMTGTNTKTLLSSPFVAATPYVGAADGINQLESLIDEADYTLVSGSNCIDAGNNAFSVSSTDLAGNARIQNGTVDLGCYETDPALSTVGNPLTKNNVLSVQNGIYYLDGAPFAEIGWNKFDINWLFWDEIYAGRALTDSNAMVVAQRNAIRDLAGSGVKTIRFFGNVFSTKFPQWLSYYNDPVKHETCWLPLDKTLDICEQYNIRAIVSLNCQNFVDRTTTENFRELVADSTSASRYFLYRYIDEVINRYKNRKGVLAWEVSNELTNTCDILPGTRINSAGERMPTMAQLALFYKQVIRRIMSIDTLRMVTSGGSYLREMAYGLSILSATNTSWPSKRDTYNQYKSMYSQIYDNSGFQNVDIHFYIKKAPNYQILANDGVTTLTMDASSFNTLSTSIGKPLMLGEFGALPKVRTDSDYWITGHDWFDTFQGETDSAQMYVQAAADQVVNSGCRLIYWWCYSSLRPQDQNDPQRADMDKNRTPILFNIVLDANNRLKQKYNIMTSDTKPTSSDRKIWYSNGVIHFSPELYGKECKVYNLQGILIKEFLARSNIPLDVDQKGIFLLKSEGTTVKIINF